MILPRVRANGLKIDWKNIRNRIRTSTGRVQVRFPSMFRDGNLLRYLIPDIVANKKIDCLAVGLNCNIEQGLSCLSDVLELPHLVSFDLRITHFPKPLPSQFLRKIEDSHIHHLIFRVDSISREDVERISKAIIHSKHICRFTFKCSMLDADTVSALGDLLMFKDENGDAKIRSLHLSVESFCDTGIVILAQSLGESGVKNLELSECKSIGLREMAVLLEELPQSLLKLVVGKNGPGCHEALFQGVERLTNLEELQCSDTSFNPDEVRVDSVGHAIKKLPRLTSLTLPLFVFDWTSEESMDIFAESVATSSVSSLQLVPLFDDIDNPRSSVPVLLTSLFNHLGHSKCLSRLYVETVGGERCLFSPSVGQSFKKFIQETSTLLELQIGYYSLIGLESDCLLALEQCPTLIGLTDDSLFCVRDHKKREEAIEFGKRIHAKIVSRLVKIIGPFVSNVSDLAHLIVQHVGIEANPEEW